LTGEALALDGAPRLTFGNIALYDTALFRELPRGAKLKLLPTSNDGLPEGWSPAHDSTADGPTWARRTTSRSSTASCAGATRFRRAGAPRVPPPLPPE